MKIIHINFPIDNILWDWESNKYKVKKNQIKDISYKKKLKTLAHTILCIITHIYICTSCFLFVPATLYNYKQFFPPTQYYSVFRYIVSHP